MNVEKYEDLPFILRNSFSFIIVYFLFLSFFLCCWKLLSPSPYSVLSFLGSFAEDQQ